MSARLRHRSSAILLALAAILCLIPSAASAQGGAHHFATLSLFDPVTTTNDRTATTNLRIALIQSYLHGVKGVDITGIASQLSGEMKGVQLTGVYSHIGGGGKGIVLSGFGNHVLGPFTGAQASIVVNASRAKFKGLQLSALANFTSGGFSGFQWAGTLNMNDGPGTGWQASPVASVSNGRFVGVQTSVFFNFANVGMKGIQVAGLNWTRHLTGAQAGVLNIAGDSKGLQLGLVNISEQNDGVPVGVINVAGNGTQNWMTWGSSYMGVQTGVRTRIGHWYSIFSIGGIYLNETDLDVVSIGWNYGYRFELTQHLSMSIDAGYLHVMPKSNDTLNDRLRPAAQGRAFLEYGFNEWVSVHAGAGGNYEWSEYASGATTQFDPLFFGGISLFGGEER